MNPYSDVLNYKKAKVTPAQKALNDAFLDLMEEKAFNLIGVSELCKKAYVARSTFYSFYANTDALLNEIENSLIFDLLKVNQDLNGEQDYVNKVVLFVSEREKALKILLIRQGDQRLMKKWKDAVKYHFWDKATLEYNQMDRELALELIASMCLSSYIWYLENRSVPDLEKLLHLIRVSIDTIA